MSRNESQISETTWVINGKDKSIGRFIDIRDERVKDEQGEGYLVEWSDMFGFSVNLLDLSFKELTNFRTVIQKVNNYVEQQDPDSVYKA